MNNRYRNTKILGVILDNGLRFVSQITSVCKKVNSMSFLLKKAIHLFSSHFRPTLFKLLIQSNFDYCSAIYINISKTDRSRLERSFSKSIYRLLNLNITGLLPEVQYTHLKKLKLMPLIYRQIFHFSSFLYSIVCKKNSSIFKIIDSYRKRTGALDETPGMTTRTPYIVPSFETDFKNYSFSRISVNFLNSFLNQFITDREICIRNKKPCISLKGYFFCNLHTLSRRLVPFIT